MKKSHTKKTQMLIPQTINAQISSQGFKKPKSELNLLSQLNERGLNGSQKKWRKGRVST
ncbi:hypothetical protein Ct9H90mP29_02470 [bacterium]|nr:MAG: hypothetical protein Ct9H90mP29_02470 [bacterium]